MKEVRSILLNAKSSVSVRFMITETDEKIVFSVLIQCWKMKMQKQGSNRDSVHIQVEVKMNCRPCDMIVFVVKPG